MTAAPIICSTGWEKIRRIPIMEAERLSGILTRGDLQAVLGLQENSVRRAATRSQAASEPQIRGEKKAPILIISEV